MTKKRNIVCKSSSSLDDEYLDLCSKYIATNSDTIDRNDLITLVNESDKLKSLIETMATNLTLFGFSIKYKNGIVFNNLSPEEKKKALKEKNLLQELFDQFSENLPFSETMYRVVYDMYAVGYGVLELIRDRTNSIIGGEHVYSYLIEQEKSENPVEIEKTRFLGGKTVKFKQMKRFKKYSQTINGIKTYFKEAGDPREMDYYTGSYDYVETPTNELLIFDFYDGSSKFALPPWYGNIPDIIGSRKSSELNLKFFYDGKITPFAIIVTNGELSDETISALENSEGLGDHYNALLIELQKNQYATGSDFNPSVQIQPLIDTSLKDSLFQEYQKINNEKIRNAFRIPPIYVGETAGHNRATAYVTRSLAEEQVFLPKRLEIATKLNKLLINNYKLEYCEFSLNSPTLSDNEEFANSIQPYIDAGVVSSNMLIPRLNELLGSDYEPYKFKQADIPLAFNQFNYNNTMEV